jgi:hydroxylysine kinase
MSEPAAVANAIPAPSLASEAEVASILADLYGIDGSATRVSSELDETFIVRSSDGTRAVLKIASPSERHDVLLFQAGALQHLVSAAPDLPVPRMIAGKSGETIYAWRRRDQARFVRLLNYLDGEQLSGVGVNSIAQLENLGRLLGQLDLALASFRPVVPAIDIAWDITHADRIMPMAHEMSDNAERRLALAAFERWVVCVKPRQAELPRQVIHDDFNPHNVLVSAADPSWITGVIDFGDMLPAARVNDPAIALSYFIGKPDGLALAAGFMRGYGGVVGLTPLEQALLPTLMSARLATTVALTEYRAARHPARAAYILRNRPDSLSGLRRMSAMTPAEVEAAFSGADA